jgi:hypothetical protein
MRELFASTYKSIRGDTPSMHGSASELYERVSEAAKARGIAARVLLVQSVHRWAKGELNARELAQPFACFAAAFGSTLEKSAGAPDRKLEIAKRSSEALIRGDNAAYEAAQREMTELLNGGEHAAH